MEEEEVREEGEEFVLDAASASIDGWSISHLASFKLVPAVSHLVSEENPQWQQQSSQQQQQQLPSHSPLQQMSVHEVQVETEERQEKLSGVANRRETPIKQLGCLR